MIWIYNSQSKVCGSYKSIEDVCDHFRRLEHMKPDSEEKLDKERWDFAYWPHKRLSALHEHLKDSHFSQFEREAYDSECDLIEIFDGSPDLADQYVVTPDLDIGSLMRDWCFDYACAHGFTILETFSSNLAGASSPVAHPAFRGGSGRFRDTLQEGGRS